MKQEWLTIPGWPNKRPGFLRNSPQGSWRLFKKMNLIARLIGYFVNSLLLAFGGK
jgi:hypothetical protein